MYEHDKQTIASPGKECAMSSICNNHMTFEILGYLKNCSQQRSYVLHVSREALSCGRDGALHFPQQVFFCFWTAHILLGHKVCKPPAGSEETPQNETLPGIGLQSTSLQVSPRPNVVPEQRIDGDLLPRDALPQHVIGEGGEAEEGLQDGVHVAGVAQVGESDRKDLNIRIIKKGTKKTQSPSIWLG